MRITFTQSGGVAGIVRGCRVDTATLSSEDRQRLEALVEASGLTASVELLSDEGRDERQYAIAIEREPPAAGQATVRVVCDESRLSPATRRLVAWLSERSGPQPLQ